MSEKISLDSSERKIYLGLLRFGRMNSRIKFNLGIYFLILRQRPLKM